MNPSFPSKYSPQEVEARIYQGWIAQQAFRASPDAKKSPFSIVIPPPNVTGILHMGHALNNTIQDVLIRFKRMQGQAALWMPGTDHAGIATQNVVERDLAKEGVTREGLGRDKFLKRLWAWTDEHGSTIIEQLKKLGASCDWDRTRFTMDQDYSQAISEVFIRLYKKGLIYRGNYIINWCPRCKTALSDEESPHRDIDGWLYYIRYPVVSAQAGGPGHIVVATTRPETMLGDTAVAINPGDSRYAYLKQAQVILPVVNRTLRVVCDEAVDPQFGTGVVKVTPAHDPVDFSLGKKYDLEFVNIMNEDATLNENVPDEFRGMDRFEARAALLEVLAEKKLIEKKEPYKIGAGHCYRCHTIIEPRISLQWFVKMKPLAGPAIKAVEEGKITFYPARWKKVYLNWMYDIQDWCISRQIWWGHRLPVYYCKGCLTQADEQGVIVAKTRPKKCPHCGSKELTQDEDVLDTWFSSWLWPFAGLYWPLTAKSKEAGLDYFYPTKVLVTASEILFFWVARMIMAGLEFMGQIPFEDVLIHGTVRDARGVKMSKSLGNTIDPLDIIEEFGADALRFSLMLLGSSGSDLHLSPEKFLVGRNFCNKIWNATRFLLLQIEKNNLKVDTLDLSQLDSVDNWALSQLNGTIREVTAHLAAYRINEAAKAAYEFFWHTFCDWYLEITKDNFTLPKAQVLIYLLINGLKLLHPVIPYITEEVYSLILEHTSLKGTGLITSPWPQEYKVAGDRKASGQVQALLDTIGEIRNIKIDLGLGTKKVRLQVAAVASSEDLWRQNRDWIRRLAGLEEIEFEKTLVRALYKCDCWEFNFAAAEIDSTGFLASLEKKLKNIKNVAQKASGKLANKNFINNAPAETVAKEKAKYQDLSRQVKRLEELQRAFR